MGVDDPQNFAGRLANERRRLEESSDVHEADREPIDQWLRRKDGSVEISSLEVYLRRVRLASERSDVPLVELDEDEFHDLTFSLRHDHGLSDSTIDSYEAAVLMFLDDMTDAEWPDDVERTGQERATVSTDEVLEPRDVQTLTETSRHQRDTAFIEFLADTGVRLSMALSLRVGDVDLVEPATYTPNEDAVGLKGAPISEFPLIDSASALRSYLRTSHPRPNDPDVALFHKLHPSAHTDDDRRWSDDGGLHANAARQQLKRIADRAGIDKPVKPHAFRHCAITRMVREGYSRSQIEHRVHWTLDTDMWETYEHITGEEHTEDIFKAAGLVEGEDGPERVRKRCGTCGGTIAPRHDFCPGCGSAATREAAERADEFDKAAFESATRATDAQAQADLREINHGIAAPVKGRAADDVDEE